MIAEDLQNVEECLERTANRADIWQDRVIHGLAIAIWHLLQWELKRIEKES